VSITKIEALTKMNFGYLREFDPLSKRKAVPVNIVNNENDIIL
jgi:hypothetical protein